MRYSSVGENGVSTNVLEGLPKDYVHVVMRGVKSGIFTEEEFRAKAFERLDLKGRWRSDDGQLHKIQGMCFDKAYLMKEWSWAKALKARGLGHRLVPFYWYKYCEIRW